MLKAKKKKNNRKKAKKDMRENTAKKQNAGLLASKNAFKKIPPSLIQYLYEWDDIYKKSINDIPLFNKNVDLSWSKEKKQDFVKLLYHVRGHFSDFLWCIGNKAPNIKSKNIILYNYAEEFGGNFCSHEQLYFYFAEAMGISSPKDVIDKKYYKPFLKKFNQGHLDWLKTNAWNGCLGAYAAYERLDNLDYVNLLYVAEKMGASNKGLIFFKVHSKAEHFDSTIDLLAESWLEDEETVNASFQFIAEHQVNMWKKVSNELLSHS